MAERKRPYRPHLKRRLSNARIKADYDYLVKIGHSKIVDEKKTLDYFLKMENRQELGSAVYSSKKVQKNQPGFKPEDTGYTTTTLEKHQEFLKKLDSEYVPEPTRNRYKSALSVVAEAGSKATKEQRVNLSKARKSVITQYGTNTRQAKINEAKLLPESDLTDTQRKLLKDAEGRAERLADVGIKQREARGLRSRIASLEGQAVKLSESLDTFVKRVVRDGYEAWLDANPSKFRLDTDPNSKTYGKKLTGTAQSKLYWDLLPDWEKQAWYDEVGEIHKHNNRIIQKYHDKGQIVPRKVQINELKQLHHIQPRRGRRPELFGEVRGGHFPAQATAVMGDAYQARKSPHGLLHDQDLDYLYGRFNSQNNMVFDLNDPNVISRKSGKPKPNIKGMSYLRDVAKSLMNLKGVPAPVKLGGAATGLLLASAGLPGGETFAGNLKSNLGSGWFWGDMLSGLDSEGFVKGLQESHLKRHGETYGQSFDRSGKFWGGLLTGDWLDEDDRSEWVRSWESPKKKREKLESIWT